MTSSAETLLAVQLEQAGIPFEREFRFAPEDWCRRHGWLTATGRPRTWRADFALRVPNLYKFAIGSEKRDMSPDFLIEIDGGGFVAGRHTRGTGFEADAEKASAAAILGYRVIRCTPRQVEDGRALSWIRQALGVEVAA